MIKNRMTGRVEAQAFEDDVLEVTYLPTARERIGAVAGSLGFAVVSVVATAGLYAVGDYADAFVVLGGWYVVSRMFR